VNTFIPDLLITDDLGKPVAAIEVKSWNNLSIDVATEMRRNMLDSGLPAQIPYFLLLSQDDGYLWKGSSNPNFDTPPMYHFPMQSVINRYSPVRSDRRLYESELSLLVLHWLANLVAQYQEITEEPEKTLAQAGFNDSIKHTIVLIEEGL